MNRLSLLALFIALPLSAATTISVWPPTPKAGDSVVVTVHDNFGSVCPATTLSATLTGQTLVIDVVPAPPGCAASICPAVVVPVAYTTPAVVFAEAKPYTIEFAITDCGGKRRVAATKQVLVRPQCAFDRSLTVNTQAATADSRVVFRWCDPSFSPFPDFGESATAYRIYLVRDGDAPILIHQQNASEGTTAGVQLAATEAGAKGAFVEADMCSITIAGCVAPFSVVKSNVVPLNVEPPRRRRATGF